MTSIRNLILVLFTSCFCLPLVHGQSGINPTDGNATGSGGSGSSTIGQISYQTFSSTNGNVAQGVQQPYEISVVTAVENTLGITLEYKIYPNPTKGIIFLTIKPYESDKMDFQLYDMNGIIIQDEKIESEVTEISMENLSPSVYFLKITKNNIEMKIFKIIKN